jgi:hypothetical protein
MASVLQDTGIVAELTAPASWLRIHSTFRLSYKAVSLEVSWGKLLHGVGN